MRKSLSGLLILIFILTAAFSAQAQEDLAARMRQGLAENFNVDQVFYDNISFNQSDNQVVIDNLTVFHKSDVYKVEKVILFAPNHQFTEKGGDNRLAERVEIHNFSINEKNGNKFIIKSVVATNPHTPWADIMALKDNAPNAPQMFELLMLAGMDFLSMENIKLSGNKNEALSIDLVTIEDFKPGSARNLLVKNLQYISTYRNRNDSFSMAESRLQYDISDLLRIWAHSEFIDDNNAAPDA